MSDEPTDSCNGELVLASSQESPMLPQLHTDAYTTYAIVPMCAG